MFLTPLNFLFTLAGSALSNLAGYLCAQGKFEDARVPNMKALKILEKTLGMDNEFTLSTLSNCIRMWKELHNDIEIQKLQSRYDNRHRKIFKFHEETPVTLALAL